MENDNNSVLVGEPIDVDRVAEPSKEQIEELHETYIRSLEKLYEENKSKYGMDDVPLEIIWLSERSSDRYRISLKVRPSKPKVFRQIDLIKFSIFCDRIICLKLI